MAGEDYTVAQAPPAEPLYDVAVPKTGSAMLPPEVAAERAYKLTVGVPKFVTDTPRVTQDILAGQEDTVRKAAAAHMDMLKGQHKQQVISSIARESGGPLSPNDLAYVNALLNEKPTDSGSVIEEGFAREHLTNLRRMGDLDHPDYWERTPQPVKEKYLTEGTDFETKRQLLTTELQNAQATLEQQTKFGYGVDMLKSLVPFYGDVKKRGNVPGTEGFQLLGSNVQAQAEKLFSLPQEEFKKTLLGMRKLGEDNPQLYVSLLQEMMGQTTGEKFVNNMFTVIDASMLKPLAIFGAAKGFKSAVQDANMVRNAYKSALQHLETPVTKAGMEEAIGDVPKAAVSEAAVKTLSSLRGEADPIKDAVDSLKNIFKASYDSIKANPGNFRQELINRLAEQNVELGARLLKTLQTTVGVERLPSVMKVEAEIRNIIKEMGNSYPNMENRLLNISTPRFEPISKTYHVDFYMGDSNGKLFTNARDAQTFANQHLIVGAIVNEETQRGTRFSIRVTKPLRETDMVVRDALLATAETQAPESWLNAWKGLLGSARTPEETLSLAQNFNRKAATYAPSTLFKIAKETSREIEQLKGWRLPFTEQKRKWDDWERVMAEAQRIADPTTGKRGGYFFSSPLEVSDLYQRVLGRVPDEKELAASFAYKRQQETLKVLNRIQSYRNKARIGAETITVNMLDEARAVPAQGGKAGYTPFSQITFDAVPINHYPKGTDSVAVFGNKLGEEGVHSTTAFAQTKAGKEVLQGILDGTYKVFRLTNPEDRLLQGFGKIEDQRIRYVITKNAEQKPLTWDQKISDAATYDYDHYIKQAIVREDRATKFKWYEGDHTIAAFNVRAQGRDFAQRLDQIRKHIQAGEIDQARAISIGKDFEEVHGWFKPTLTDEGKTLPPRLSVTEPIQVVPRNKTIGGTSNELSKRHGDNFRDGTIEGYGRQFSNDPDVHEVFTTRTSGTKANPLYDVTPAKFIDPITSINRSLTKAINNTWLDDYKIFSVEHWAKEAEQLLRVDPEELWQKPYYYFFNPVWREGANTKKVNDLLTARFQIQQFLGVENTTSTFLHDIANRIADVTYDKLGAKAALIPGWALPKLRDPFAFMRAVTFHAKLGLFSVPQLMVQMQTYATILGVAGYEHAAPGAKAAWLHGLTLYNSSPEIMAHLDKLMTKRLLPGTSRWLPGQFTEAHELLTRTGFGSVAGEHVLRDNPFKYDIISSKGKQFLDWGTVFFREGERNVRYGAFYTAYREFRATNAAGRITDSDLKLILQRADLLSVNMSRASASTLHQGVFSIPTQFLSYQLRLAELTFGKRLDAVERGRLIATYSMLYGVPGAYGLTGLPFGDYIQKWQREDGYQVGENWAMTAINEGIPSLLLGLTTGKYYNVPERYGAQGFSQISDALKSDKTMWDVLGGAAYSTFANTLARSDGFASAVMSMFSDDRQHFRLKTEDFVDVFKEISSVNNAWRVKMAVETGNWMTKKEGYLTDTSLASAAFMFLTGLQPQEATDLNLMSWQRKDEKALQQHGLEQFTREFRRGLRAMNDNDPTQASDYFRRAKTYLKITGYPTEDYGKAYSIAAKDHESIINRVKWDYFTEKVPSTSARKQYLPNALRSGQ